MSVDINSRGDSAELGAATTIRRLGGQVSFPFGDNAPYDLIADVGGSLYRVQVKTAKQRDGESNSIRAPLSTASGYGYGDTVDSIVVYNPNADEYYWLWPSECAKLLQEFAWSPEKRFILRTGSVRRLQKRFASVTGYVTCKTKARILEREVVTG